MARKSSRSSDVISVLDLGTSKVCCIIAQPDLARQQDGPDAGLRVIGIGHQRSRGLKAGVILDLDEAEAAIRAAVSQAERMAGQSVHDVYVSVACGRLRSLTYTAKAEISSGSVRAADIARVLSGGKCYAQRDGRLLLQLTQIGFRLDGASGIRDPRGMAASTLTADLHAVTADEAPVRNLLLVVERCHLSVAGLIVAPYASTLAVTTPEERRLGVTVVDVGGGTTTICMFAEDHFLHAEVLPVGGNHVTFDVARALSTPVAEAERIKALYGTMIRARSDVHELISYPVTGEDDGSVRHTTKAELNGVLHPRVDSILSLVRERVQRAPVAAVAARRLVLTGGGSQLVGLGEVVADLMGCPVRVARPVPVAGLPSFACSPAFAVVVGMLHAAAAGEPSAGIGDDFEGLPPGYLRRVGSWLREF